MTDIKKRGGKRVGAGRPLLAEDKKKPSTMVRVPDAIKGLVLRFKDLFNEGLIDSDLCLDFAVELQFSDKDKLIQIFKQDKQYKQTSVLSDTDMQEQAKYIESLESEKAELLARVGLLDKNLQGNNQQATIERLTKENDSLQVVKDNGIDLVLKYDREHLKVVELQAKVKDLEREPKRLNSEIKRLRTLEHTCQCLKTNGDRCTRLAKVTADYQGVKLHVCLQHEKSLVGKNKKVTENVKV